LKSNIVIELSLLKSAEVVFATLKNSSLQMLKSRIFIFPSQLASPLFFKGQLGPGVGVGQAVKVDILPLRKFRIIRASEELILLAEERTFAVPFTSAASICAEVNVVNPIRYFVIKSESIVDTLPS